jgi:hypothetical protein
MNKNGSFLGSRNSVVRMDFWFPQMNGIDYNKLQMSLNSSYSITKPKDAKQIEGFINKYIGGKNLTILDGTANVGGDVINFGLNPNVEKVVAIEINADTFSKLENNIRVYGLEKKIKAIHGNSLDIIEKCADRDHFDILFLDAPWGGKSYKKHKFLNLEMSGKKLVDVVKMAQKCQNIDNIILKIPFNYNLYQLISNAEFHTIVIDKIKTGKSFYMILLLSIKK